MAFAPQSVTPGYSLAHRAFGSGSEQVGRDHSELREFEVLLETFACIPHWCDSIIFGAESSRVWVIPRGLMLD